MFPRTGGAVAGSFNLHGRSGKYDESTHEMSSHTAARDTTKISVYSLSSKPTIRRKIDVFVAPSEASLSSHVQREKAERRDKRANCKMEPEYPSVGSSVATKSRDDI